MLDSLCVSKFNENFINKPLTINCAGNWNELNIFRKKLTNQLLRVKAANTFLTHTPCTRSKINEMRKLRHRFHGCIQICSQLSLHVSIKNCRNLTVVGCHQIASFN